MPNLALHPPVRRSKRHWVTPARRGASLLSPREFFFLNERGAMDELGWDGAQREKLWRYNQHYFDDLNARDGDKRTDWHRSLLRDWVLQNSPGRGTGWEPYPTSLRIVNWIKWVLAGNVLPDECVQSLAVQARWLERRLENHLLGNHLFSNAKALTFAGLFFDGEEATRWLRRGLRILEREVPEQILSDGGHFERSTMYHALALEDMLDLCNIGACYLAALDEGQQDQLAHWRMRVPKMVDWLCAMCHPDGEIGLFNDAATGISASVTELVDYAVRLGFEAASEIMVKQAQTANADQTSLVRAHHLRDSGYVRLESLYAVALLDVAQVGPDYLPGHAHADTLSFELSLFGRRLFVNSGTSCYGISTERLRQRGTAAHNTVVIDGQDSSEVWASFRVARRARPFGLKIGAPESLSLEARCSHDGYRRLAGKPVHERYWRLREHELVIEDQVSGDFMNAEARFHLHPLVRVTIDDNCNHGEIIFSGNEKAAWWADAGKARLEPATYHPQFGISQMSQCLVLSLKDGKARLRLAWA